MLLIFFVAICSVQDDIKFIYLASNSLPLNLISSNWSAILGDVQKTFVLFIIPSCIAIQRRLLRTARYCAVNVVNMHRALVSWQCDIYYLR